jgi:hypothetical protein
MGDISLLRVCSFIFEKKTKNTIYIHLHTYMHDKAWLVSSRSMTWHSFVSFWVCVAHSRLHAFAYILSSNMNELINS